MDTLELISRLEQIVGGASKMPLTSKVIVDSRLLLEVVDQLRAAVPQDVRDAQQILEKREGIINQALMDARKVKSSADQESKAKVDQSELVKASQKRSDEISTDTQRKADKILADAQRQVEAMRGDADRYALDVLSKLEAQLNAQLNAARRGIEQLEQTAQAAA